METVNFKKVMLKNHQNAWTLFLNGIALQCSDDSSKEFGRQQKKLRRPRLFNVKCIPRVTQSLYYVPCRSRNCSHTHSPSLFHTHTHSLTHTYIHSHIRTHTHTRQFDFKWQNTPSLFFVAIVFFFVFWS
jgi:hypothetical protein